MAGWEFVDPLTGLALGPHAYGPVASGTASTPWPARLRYLHGESGSGRPANALVLEISEDLGLTWRPAVTEFTLAITAISNPPSDPLFLETVRSLGRGSRWQLAPFRAGCSIDLAVTVTPDKRTGAAEQPLRFRLGIDETPYRAVAEVPDWPVGVLSGIGVPGVRETILAPTLTNGTDEVTLGAHQYVHDGIRHELAAGAVALSQDDGAGATLAAAQEYVAVLTVGSNGRTVTKGAKATAGSAVAPALPAGEKPEATVRVPYGGVIVSSTLHAISGRCAVSLVSGLTVAVQPGRVSLPGWLAEPSAVQEITVPDGSVPATGSVTCVAVANLIDGETVTIAGKTYEFDVAGNGVAGGNVAVDVSALTTASEVATALALAIYDEGDCGLVWDGVSATIELVRSIGGAAGNEAGSDTVADAGFVYTGLSGGADGTVTVRLNDAAAASTTEGAALAVATTGGGAILSLVDARRLLGLEPIRISIPGAETVANARAAIYIPHPWAVDTGDLECRVPSVGATGSTAIELELDGTPIATGSVAAQASSGVLTFTSFSGEPGWLTVDFTGGVTGGTPPADFEVILWIARRG